MVKEEYNKEGKDKKRLRHFVAETVGEARKAFEGIPDEELITTGEPYNFLLIEEYEGGSEGIGKYIRIRELTDEVSDVNENVCCENIWFKN